MRPINTVKNVNPLNTYQQMVMDYIEENNPTIDELTYAFKFRSVDVYQGLKRRGLVFMSSDGRIEKKK